MLYRYTNPRNNLLDLDLLRSGHPPSLGGLVHPVDVVVHVQHELHLREHEVYFYKYNSTRSDPRSARDVGRADKEFSRCDHRRADNLELGKTL